MLGEVSSEELGFGVEDPGFGVDLHPQVPAASWVIPRKERVIIPTLKVTGVTGTPSGECLELPL